MLGRGAMLPVYLINLDRSPDRLAFFSGQAARLGIPFRRRAAVDAAALAEPLPDIDYGPEVDRYRLGYAACTLSHIGIWRDIANGPDEWSVIFEDDVVLSDALPAFLESSSWIPEGAQIVKLEAFSRAFLSRRAVSAPANREIRRLAGVHLGAAGYMLSRSAAGELCRTAVPARHVVDHLLFGAPERRAHALTVFQVSPALCIQDRFLRTDDGRPAAHESTIETDATVPLPKRTAFKQAARELTRFGERIRAWIDGAAKLSVPFL